MHHAAEVFLDAASTFNVLLEKYRNLYQTHSSSRSISLLCLSNPSMIYLIFTAAIAHLSGFKLRQQQQQREAKHESVTRSTTMALQTQLHLLNCSEALTAIGGTWELARRCWRTLDRLMEVEGMKPRSAAGPSNRSLLGTPQPAKRKREEEENGQGRAGTGYDAVKRRASDSSMISSIYDSSLTPSESPTLVNQPSASYSSSQQQSLHGPSPSSVIGWNSQPTGGGLGLSPLPLGTEFFDPASFSSNRWLSEILDVDSIGLGMVWDGEWDESFLNGVGAV